MSKVIEEGCVEGEEYLNVFMVRKRVSVLCSAYLRYMLSEARCCAASYMLSYARCRPTVDAER